MEQEIENKLIELELRLLDESVRASKTELERLIADDFLEIAATGVSFGKREAIERIPSEIAPEFTSTNFNVRQLAESVVQITYKATIKKANEDKIRYSQRSSIWKLNETGWQMIFHQGTPCSKF